MSILQRCGRPEIYSGVAVILARKRAELLAHIHNTNSQYNLPEIGKRLANKANREGVADHFPDPSVHKAIEVDVSLIDHYDQLLGEVELYLTRSAKAA